MYNWHTVPDLNLRIKPSAEVASLPSYIPACIPLSTRHSLSLSVMINYDCDCAGLGDVIGIISKGFQWIWACKIAEDKTFS